MPRLREVIEATKTKVYYRATVCRTCVLAVPRTIKVGLTEVRNQAKPQNYSEKESYISYQFKQMFKCVATDLDKEPTPKQQRLT
jgi:glutaredoxin 2